MNLPLIDTDLKFFKVGEREYVLDVPSSTLFEVHPQIKKILELSIHNLSTDYLADLKKEFHTLDWVEMTGELKYLIDHRYLTIYASKISPYILKEQKVNSITLNISHDCNMNCRYCYQKGGIFGQETEYMDQGVVAKSIEYLFKESPDQKVFVNISGGEPLLNVDLVKFILQTIREYQDKYEKKVAISLTTNGTLLEKELLEFLARENVELKIHLDGTAKDHNQMRVLANGRLSYDLIHERLKLVKESGIRYRVKGIFHHLNLKHFQEMMEMYRKDKYAAIRLEPIIATPDQEYALTQEDLDQLCNHYDELFDLYQEEDPFAQRLVNLNSAVSCIACKQNHGYTCGAGKNYLCITPNGDLYPCHLLVGNEEFLLGNIMEGTLNEELRQTFYQPLHVLNKEGCKVCWARYFCGGGCVGENYLATGSLVAPYQPRCQLNKFIYEKAIQVYCASLNDDEKIQLTQERRKVGREIYKIS